MGVWKTSSLVVGSRIFKTTHKHSPESLQQWRSPSKGQKYAGHDAHAKELPPLPNPAASMLTEGTKCQPMATSQRYPHQVTALPGHMCQIPSKATSVNIGVPIVQAPQ